MGAVSFGRRVARDPLYANGLALVANAGLSAALGFLFWMVAARRFNADALGVGAAVVSAATLAALVGKAGFDAAVIRYAPAASPTGVRKVLFKALAATLGLTFVVAATVLLIGALGVPALTPLLEPAFAAGFLLLAVGTAGAWVLDSYYVAEQRSMVVLARNLAFNVVKLGVPIFLALSWGGRAVPLAWGLGLVAGLAVLVLLLPGTLARHRPVGAKPEGNAFGYAMRNYALNLSEFLPGLVLPILVLNSLGAEENARFFLAWTVATVALLASKAIAQTAFAAQVRDGEAAPALKKGLLLSGALLLPAGVVLYFGAPLILSLFGAHYAGAADLLKLLALSIPFVALSNLYLSYLKARDARWELTLLPLISLLVLLATMPFALAWLGILGAGLAWLGVQMALGLYAAARFLAKTRRMNHGAPRFGIRRHLHQG